MLCINLAFACMLKLKCNLMAKDSSNSYKIQENESLSTENGTNSKETKIQIGQNDINFSNQINGEKKNKPITFADIVNCINFVKVSRISFKLNLVMKIQGSP